MSTLYETLETRFNDSTNFAGTAARTLHWCMKQITLHVGWSMSRVKFVPLPDLNIEERVIHDVYAISIGGSVRCVIRFMFDEGAGSLSIPMSVTRGDFTWNLSLGNKIAVVLKDDEPKLPQQALEYVSDHLKSHFEKVYWVPRRPVPEKK